MMSEGATKTTIADKAKEIVYGDRERTYGHPGKNLKVIADASVIINTVATAIIANKFLILNLLSLICR